MAEASLGVERGYGVDHRACRDRIDVLVSVRSGVFKKNGCQGAGMTKAEVSGDDGTSQQYSNQGSRTTVRLRS